MKQLDGKETYKAMMKKGFVAATNKSNDHKWLEFWHNGKLTRAKTKFSHNGQDLNDFLIGQIAKQIGVTKKQFIEFAECTLTQKQYVDILKQQNKL